MEHDKIISVSNLTKTFGNFTAVNDISFEVSKGEIFGFLGAILVVFISTRTDIAVLLGYIVYYSYMARIVNRPKYVTDLGKLIVFPLPSAAGAFTGYKLSLILITYLQTL